MNEESNNETVAERLERKRREFQEALEQHKVDGPLIAGGFLLSFGKMLLFSALSFAVSIGTSLLIRALQGPQKIRRGSLAGQELRFTRSDLGIFVPEIYGHSPCDAAERRSRVFISTPQVTIRRNSLDAQ